MPKQKRLTDSERQTLAGRSKTEVDAAADMTAEASQIGIRICTITEHDDEALCSRALGSVYLSSDLRGREGWARVSGERTGLQLRLDSCS